MGINVPVGVSHVFPRKIPRFCVSRSQSSTTTEVSHGNNPHGSQSVRRDHGLDVRHVMGAQQQQDQNGDIEEK